MSQLRSDRTIDLEFGVSPAHYHLIIEFYSKGRALPLVNA